MLGWRLYIQFLPSLKMLVIIEEIITALSPGSMVYTAILTWIGRLYLAQRTRERFWCEVFIFGW